MRVVIWLPKADEVRYGQLIRSNLSFDVLCGSCLIDAGCRASNDLLKSMKSGQIQFETMLVKD